MRLFFKKLLAAVFRAFLFFVLWAVIATVWFMSVEETDPSSVSVLVSAVTAGLIVLGTMFWKRYRQLAAKTEFLKQEDLDMLSFGEDFADTAKSKDCLVGALATATMLLALLLAIVLSEPTDVAVAIVSAAIFFLVFFVVCLLVDALLWCVIHRLWLRGRTAQE